MLLLRLWSRPGGAAVTWRLTGPVLTRPSHVLRLWGSRRLSRMPLPRSGKPAGISGSRGGGSVRNLRSA
eukprot:6486327-Lingulodinium_polyedra.AAC.1